LPDQPHLVVFGPGYSAGRVAALLAARGWRVSGVRRAARERAIAIDDEPGIAAALATATHILSSVPPDRDGDPVLARYASAIAAAPAGWSGYLSSTGVYGDTNGAWVDESAPVRVGEGRGGRRAAAERAWSALRPDMRVFRLPGIYGPGRSALDRVAAGAAHRVDKPDHVFSRIHVDDIAAAVVASLTRGRAGAYNIADDRPAHGNDVVAFAAALLRLPMPPMLPDESSLSPMARSFWAESRRVASGRARRLLGWQPRYPDYRAGLRALSAITSPASTSTDPSAAVADQR